MKMKTICAALSGAFLLGSAALYPAYADNHGKMTGAEKAPAGSPVTNPVKNAKVAASAEWEAERDRIEADYKAAKERCDGMKDNAKDVCMAEAKGKQKIAKAELDVKRKGTPESQKDLAEVKAKAEYDIAKEKCDEMKGKEKDACQKQAKAERDKALAVHKKDKKVASREVDKPADRSSPAAGTSMTGTATPSGAVANTMSPSGNPVSPNANVTTQGTPTGASKSSAGTTGTVDAKQEKTGK